MIEILVFPSTGNDSQSQYVCVRLIVKLITGYPDISPEVNFRNPRGLDEGTMKLIQSEAEEKCHDFVGQPVMFELIEVRKMKISISLQKKKRILLITFLFSWLGNI